MKRNLTILACLVIFVAVFGCRRKPSDETEQERPGSKTPAQIDTKAVGPKQATKAASDGVAVTINGVPITEKEVEAEVKQISTRRPPAELEKNREKIRQMILDRMIAKRLINEKIQAANIAVTEEEVLAKVEEIAAQQRTSLENFKKMLQSRGMDYDEWKQQVQWGVMLEKLVEADFGDQLNITDTDANNFYSANIKQYEKPEQVRASHILVRPDTTDPNVDPNEAKAQALAKAQGLLKQIKDGADFAELAKATGGYPSAPKGGDLGFIDKGRMVPAFDKVAFALKVNEISDIVETPFGYHIIKVTDHKAAGVTPFEQARDEIKTTLKRRKQSELFQKYLVQLKAGAKIVYPPGKEPLAAPPGP